MATETPKTDDSPAAETPPPAGKPSLLGKIKVLAIVAVLVVVECIAAYLVLPSAADVSAQAAASSGSQPAAEAPQQEEPAEPAEEPEAAKHEQMEVSLGQFMVSAFQPGAGTTLRIDFRLFGMVAAREEKEFTKLKEANLHRFRDQVIITLRSAEPADLTDPDLSTIKRRLLERTNRVLGKPLLRGVVFSEFSCVEQ